jgi:hypothetical protein
METTTAKKKRKRRTTTMSKKKWKRRRSPSIETVGNAHISSLPFVLMIFSGAENVHLSECHCEMNLIVFLLCQ